MAKRKRNEFRPDPKGTGLLSKLYLTPTQRRRYLKWLLYCALCVGVLVVQDVILSRLTLLGGVADLTPCAIMLVCVLEGCDSGSVFALLASVFYYYSGSAPGSYCIVLIVVCAVAAAAFRQGYLRRSFGAQWMCTVAAAAVYQAVVFGIGVFLLQTNGGRALSFLMNWALSAAALPVLYPAFNAVGKIGGEKWKE